MRLIDADALLDKCSEQCGEKSCDTCQVMDKEHCARYMAVKEAKTAYDPDKVIEKLRKLEPCSTCLHTDECCTCFVGEFIEIVRNGGVE